MSSSGKCGVTADLEADATCCLFLGPTVFSMDANSVDERRPRYIRSTCKTSDVFDHERRNGFKSPQILRKVGGAPIQHLETTREMPESRGMGAWSGRAHLCLPPSLEIVFLPMMLTARGRGATRLVGYVCMTWLSAGGHHLRVVYSVKIHAVQ